MQEKVNVASVTVSVQSAAGDKETQINFNTPKMLAIVESAPEDSKVKITIAGKDGEEPKVLLEGGKDEAVKALIKSIVPPDKIALELRKFAQFLLDHSSLKGIGIHAICSGTDDKDTGFGFVTTSPDCTAAHAVALVNCGDANIDEFISKAKLEVPGRNGSPAKGTVITPTPDQVEKLG